MEQMLSALSVDENNDANTFADDPNSKCAGCSASILDPYLSRVQDRNWHETCVKCVACGQELTDSCFERDGQLYCRLHYYRQFSIYHCTGCGQGISPSDVVYKISDQVMFHTHCHCCVHCGRPLCPGEKILVNYEQHTVACYEHYENPTATDNKVTASESVEPNFDVAIAAPTSSTSIMDKAFKMPKLEDTLGSMQSMYNSDGDSFMYASCSGDYFGDDMKYLKRRGPRTTIKQNQLDVLNRIFTATPKPSKHARAKLALETGLTMRVIQVWFQNRRSKERRLKHLCNWIRENENRGFIPSISPLTPPLAACRQPQPQQQHAMSTSPLSGTGPCTKPSDRQSYASTSDFVPTQTMTDIDFIDHSINLDSPASPNDEGEPF